MIVLTIDISSKKRYNSFRKTKGGKELMIIPKHLRWYERAYAGDAAALADAKKDAERFVTKARNAVKDELRYDSIGEAKKAALAFHIKADKANDDAGTLLSVWKEPSDIGNGYAIISHDNRENAGNAGYTECVTINDIFEAAKRTGVDEIEEV